MRLAHGFINKRLTAYMSTTTRPQSRAALAFSAVEQAQPDPMQDVKKMVDGDHNSQKVDLGQGVYRNESGQYHEFQTLKKSKALLHAKDANHDYNPTTGISTFCKAGAKLVFGEMSHVLEEGRVASVQTVAGTGANRTGAAFLRRHLRTLDGNVPDVYVGEPAWGNYRPLFENAGFNVLTFLHSSRTATKPNLQSLLQALQSAPRGSIFVLQACCHNPTGLDYSLEEWRLIADSMVRLSHFAFFDNAYQGFASSQADGLEHDAFAIRHFAEKGVPLLVCQSFSKNFGLYSERVGALHVVCGTAGIVASVFDQLRVQIRWEFSSAPAYGAKLVDIILNDATLKVEWHAELRNAAARIEHNRHELHRLLTTRSHAPGNWDHILAEKGLFSYTALSGQQVSALGNEHSVYMAPNGRINVAGLSKINIEKTAKAIHDVMQRLPPREPKDC